MGSSWDTSPEHAASQLWATSAQQPWAALGGTYAWARSFATWGYIWSGFGLSGALATASAMLLHLVQRTLLRLLERRSARKRDKKGRPNQGAQTNKGK